jgi:hypothetical protein
LTSGFQICKADACKAGTLLLEPHFQSSINHLLKVQAIALYYLFFSIFYCFVGWGYIVAFAKVLKIYQIYHIWIYLLPWSPLSSLPIPKIVSAGTIFAFTYICTQFLHYIHPPIPFPCHHLPPSTGHWFPPPLCKTFSTKFSLSLFWNFIRICDRCYCACTHVHVF